MLVRFFERAVCVFLGHPVFFLFLLASFIAQPQSACSQASPADDFYAEGRKYVSVSIIADRSAIQPAETTEQPDARIGVLFRISPGWHIYWRNPGEAGLATKVSWNLPDGWRASTLRWPIPRKIKERGEIVTFGYAEEVLLISDLFAPPLDPDGSMQLKVSALVKWLVCSDVCIPGQAVVEELFSFSLDSPLQVSKEFSLFEHYQRLLPAASLAEFNAKHSLDIQFSAVTSHEKLRQNSTAHAALVLHGLPSEKAGSINGQVQFFPLESENISAGQAAISRLAGGSSFLVSFPLDVLEDAPPGELEVAGIIALSPSLTGAQTASAFPWSFKTTVVPHKQVVPPASSFEKLQQDAEAPQALTYLLHEQEKRTAGASPLFPQKPTLPFRIVVIAVVFGFIGGILLNLMPCVLPIIAIKAMGFVHAAQQSRTKAIASSIWFTAGVLASFLALAGLVVFLRSLGLQLGWGFQFQHPAYVLALTLIVFVIALGFFDVYTVEVPGISKADRVLSRLSESPWKSFFEGVLTCALSTPCSAPFLSTALVVAFTQPAVFTFAVFLSIGAGLALPYIVLTTSPRFAEKLPAPGNWMLRLRQFLGFLLLATALWLLFVLHRLTGPGVLHALALLLLIYFGFWLHTFGSESARKLTKVLATSLALAVNFAFFTASYPKMTMRQNFSLEVEETRIPWQSFSADKLGAARESAMPVFLVFTADWCLTCKANEFLVIETERIGQAINELGILPLKADWTTGDEHVTRALKEYGSSGVPYYVVFPAEKNSPPIILPTILTTETLLQALKRSSIKQDMIN